MLLAQGLAGASLLRANTAFQDEALYLWAGHLQISAWLHGTPIPAFPTFFSGAPVLYPPLAAVADALGGLTGARLLSLLFMLGATTLLWSTVRQLHGRVPAFFACALFALWGPSLRLGAFATYDAMSLLLMAAAARCAVQAGRSRGASGWLVAAAVALAAANATKYASAIFDPVVLGLAWGVAARTMDWRAALGRALTLGVYTAGILGALLVLGGGEYLTGIAATTFARSTGSTPSAEIATQAWQLGGPLLALAVLGGLAAWLGGLRGPDRLLILLMVVAGLLVPVAYLHLGSLTSFSKHIDFGLWFVAIAAGVGLGQLLRPWRTAGPRRLLTAGMALTMCLPAWAGLQAAHSLFRTWPDSRPVVSTAARVLSRTRGPILAENPSLFEYYLPQGRQWLRWSSGCSIRLPSGRSISQPVGNCYRNRNYVSFVDRGYFSAVILLFGDKGQFDGPLTRALSRSPRYRRAAQVVYGRQLADIWVRHPQPRQGESLAGLPHTTPLQAILIPEARP
ncbi:MAG: glycosyltransferase family 39 protein, partial [Candidatus Dormibacteria bacterium]